MFTSSGLDSEALQAMLLNSDLFELPPFTLKPCFDAFQNHGLDAIHQACKFLCDYSKTLRLAGIG